jgi:hypothetical protein
VIRCTHGFDAPFLANVSFSHIMEACHRSGHGPGECLAWAARRVGGAGRSPERRGAPSAVSVESRACKNSRAVDPGMMSWKVTRAGKAGSQAGEIQIFFETGMTGELEVAHLMALEPDSVQKTTHQK